MNHIYRLVWSVTKQAWIVTGEFCRAHKKTKLLCVATTLSIAGPVGASNITTGPITQTLQPGVLFSASSVSGENGAEGSAGYLFETEPGSLVEQNQVMVDRSVLIVGGFGDDGLDGSYGGKGGVAMSGTNLTVTNGGNILGGYGGSGGSSTSLGGQGGDGGAAISDSNLTIFNSGFLSGGNGGNGGSGIIGSYSSGGNGGNGGVAIDGSELTIINNGILSGGKGGNGGDGSGGGSSGGHGGNGGNGNYAISGSNLTITNSGIISGGNAGSRGVAIKGNGSAGSSGNAIHLTGGANTLTLEQGSNITGDVVLDNTSNGSTTSVLSINSNAATTLNGNLIIANGDLNLSGQTLTVNGVAAFNGTTISASKNLWEQSSYTLLDAAGIAGLYSLNNLPTDYATLYLSGSQLIYSLNWAVPGATNGTFTLNTGDALTLATPLADNSSAASSWDGKSLNKAGEGTLTLAAANTYTGSTTVSAGTLKTGVADAFSSTSGVTVANGAILNLGGNSQRLASGATLNNDGILLFNDSGASALLQTVNLYGNVINSGAVIINNGAQNAGQTLQVNGNWMGNGGTLSLGTILGDDSSLTDKLAITGNASGTTYVAVANEGGSGAQTLNGIELITTGSSSANAFVQSGRIAAGAYDYSLVRGAGSNSSNWYLTSSPTAVNPTPVNPTPVNPTPVNPTPVNPTPVNPTPGNPTPSNPTPDAAESVLRPEAGAYSANLAAANTLFATRLQDRLGETQYFDVLTGETKMTSMWIRSEGGHTRSHDSSGQLSTQANRYVAQLGGDLAQWSTNGDDRYHLGIMAGYGNSKSNTNSSYSGYRAHSTVEGYSTGLYGSWHENDADKTGLYVGTWAQYNWFKNTIAGQGLASEKYDAEGITASLESGYTFSLGQNESGTQTYFIQPNAQITWMNVKAGTHTESNGTVVSGEGDGNVKTTLGVKSFLNGHSKLDDGKDRNFQPFVEVNWVHNTKDFGSRMDGVLVKQSGASNIAEMKVGLDGQLSKQFGLWGNVAQQIGDKGYSDTSVMLGGKYSF